MKKFLMLLGMAAVLASPAVPVAQAAADLDPAYLAVVTTQLHNQLFADEQSPLNLINWKVGDTAEYTLMGGLGSMIKSVSKEEGNAIWLRQDVNIIIQKQVIETLISRVDGKILKMLVDGKEQAIPNDPVEIISQDYGKVTVPAGTFDAIHVVAKTKQISKIEVWMNPTATVMDGTLKQVANQSGMDIVIELKSFKKMP